MGLLPTDADWSTALKVKKVSTRTHAQRNPPTKQTSSGIWRINRYWSGALVAYDAYRSKKRL